MNEFLRTDKTEMFDFCFLCLTDLERKSLRGNEIIVLHYPYSDLKKCVDIHVHMFANCQEGMDVYCSYYIITDWKKTLSNLLFWKLNQPVVIHVKYCIYGFQGFALSKAQ